MRTASASYVDSASFAGADRQLSFGALDDRRSDRDRGLVVCSPLLRARPTPARGGPQVGIVDRLDWMVRLLAASFDASSTV